MSTNGSGFGRDTPSEVCAGLIWVRSKADHAISLSAKAKKNLLVHWTHNYRSFQVSDLSRTGKQATQEEATNTYRCTMRAHRLPTPLRTCPGYQGVRRHRAAASPSNLYTSADCLLPASREKNPSLRGWRNLFALKMSLFVFSAGLQKARCRRAGSMEWLVKELRETIWTSKTAVKAPVPPEWPLVSERTPSSAIV